MLAGCMSVLQLKISTAQLCWYQEETYAMLSLDVVACNAPKHNSTQFQPATEANAHNNV